MKLNKSTILIFCLLMFASVAHSSERASISATATVIPMLGIMPSVDFSQSNSFKKQTATSLLIQAPKNSALLIHIANVNNGDCKTKYLESSYTEKNSVSDIFSYTISKNQPKQIVTIIPIDN